MAEADDVSEAVKNGPPGKFRDAAAQRYESLRRSPERWRRSRRARRSLFAAAGNEMARIVFHDGDERTVISPAWR
jgi:hypothetical protein